MTYLAKIFYMVLVLLLVSCQDGHSEIRNILTVIVKDLQIDQVNLKTCSSEIKLGQSVEKFEYIHEGCINTNYRFEIIYKDGEMLRESVGYIPGVEPVRHVVKIENKKIVVQIE